MPVLGMQQDPGKGGAETQQTRQPTHPLLFALQRQCCRFALIARSSVGPRCAARVGWIPGGCQTLPRHGGGVLQLRQLQAPLHSLATSPHCQFHFSFGQKSVSTTSPRTCVYGGGHVPKKSELFDSDFAQGPRLRRTVHIEIYRITTNKLIDNRHGSRHDACLFTCIVRL
jgi:hypothetical protein